MTGTPTIHEFDSLERLVDRLRDDFVSGNHELILIFAYNRILFDGRAISERR